MLEDLKRLKGDKGNQGSSSESPRIPVLTPLLGHILESPGSGDFAQLASLSSLDAQKLVLTHAVIPFRC